MVVTENLPNPPASVSEVDTVTALRAGDAETFRELVADLNPGLTRLAKTYVTGSLADEIVQETWAAVIQGLDSFQSRSSLKTWIYRIMLNKVRTLAKRESKIVPFAAMGMTNQDWSPVDADRLVDQVSGARFWSSPPAMWHELPAEALESEEVLMMILEAIEALPPAQREVVELRDIQGWSPEDVCRALDISSVNQRVLLHRGRATVRAMLEEYLTNDG